MAPKERKSITAQQLERNMPRGDALAKIFSSILKERLNEVMKAEGIENQSGLQPLRGCQDRPFVI
jgi:hypothetical protein